MLTQEQIQENKIKFLELLSKLNFDMTDISLYLDGIDYFNAPNTSQYFRAYPGGLCQTALELYSCLKKQVDMYLPGYYTEQDIITVALFKNIYRAEMYECINGVYKTRSGKVRPTYGDLGFSSYMTVRHFLKDLTDEQVEAICHGSVTDNSIDIHEVRRSYPLVALTAVAELLITTFSKE